MKCEECYSENSRATPLLKPLDCLNNHLQYICGTCGRCICIERDPKRKLQRWNFPFKAAELALLYLRTAEATLRQPCAIYEIHPAQGGRSFKIFPSVQSLQQYLAQHKDKRCNGQAVYQSDTYREFANTQIRKLEPNEVQQYLQEQKHGQGVGPANV